MKRLTRDREWKKSGKEIRLRWRKKENESGEEYEGKNGTFPPSVSYLIV